MAEPGRAGAIAIVGLAGRFPGARGLEDFWRNVRDGVEALETFSDADLDAARVDPAARAHPSYVRRGTVLEDADGFDAGFFGFAPREAQVLDPQHRVFLECAWAALEHAGHAGAAAGKAVGVYAGAGMNTYLLTQLLANLPFVATVGAYQVMLGNDKDFLATRVSYKLDLRGPSMNVQTACSTSLVAVGVACRALQRGECDLALAGGVSIAFPQRAGYLYQEGMIFSPDGHCRPFDADARGTRAGSGAGVVVLRRLADALADRDTIHAVILGSAINNDGAAKAGYTAPSVDGQVEVIATAQALAGVDPRSIAYLETHGTGTPLGDPVEIAALTQVFRAATADRGFCRLGSLKANLGHLDVAAGVASLIKTVLVLQHGELPPLVNWTRANPQLDLERSPFVASDTAAPWPRTAGAPRRAGVSSFGIGGTNAHVIVEEAPPPPPRTATRAAHLLVLSARTPTALEQATRDLAAHLAAAPDAALDDVAFTLQAGRRAFPHRRAVVARDAAHAAALLAQAPRPPVVSGVAPGSSPGVAFLFSGQGSQHAGMGAGLYRSERVFRETIDRCAAILAPHLGLDLRPALYDEPAAPVDATWLAQPLLFATEVALARLWMHRGVVPRAMIGHSLGEYTAAHLAGVMSLEDALAVVAARGRIMQALPAGAMAAVPLAPAELAPWLTETLELAAINAPALCAVSGPADEVAGLVARLAAAGIDARPLHTSHAFHSAMMEPALAPFAEILGRVTLSPPAIPYLSNVTGTWITDAQATSPAYHASHLRRAVRFEAGVRALAADPALLLLEVGPGNALTSLARLTLGPDGPRRVLASLAHPRERRPDLDATLEATARLWVAGVSLDRDGLGGDERPRRVPLPTYPFERTRHWVDPAPSELPPAGLRVGGDVSTWMYVPAWTRDDSLAAAPSRLRGTWLVLAAPGALGEAVARHAAAAGATAIVVEPGAAFARLGPSRYQVRPGVDADLAALLREVGAVVGAIHLWGAGDASAARSYHAVVALAAVLDTTAGPRRLVVATVGSASVLAEPVRDPLGALAHGPALVLPEEVPGLAVCAVDVEVGDVEVAARELVEEAAAGDRERLVARRAGRRWVQRVERAPLPVPAPADLPLKAGAVVLITGGTGGVGLTLARWLAGQARARLVLVGRTAQPPPAAIREIEEAGGEVLVAAADVADEAALRAVVDEVGRRWGAIDGVIHAAGVPGTGAIAFRKQPEDVAAVLAPKVDGLRALARILGDTPLDFVALVGSINAVVGAPGVCDYASANAVLAAFVDSSERPAAWRRVMSIDYGPWREVGMAARLVVPETQRQARDELLRLAIPPAAGVDTFARVLASGRRRVIVSSFDLVQVTEASRQAARPPAPPPPAASRPGQARPALSSSYAPPATDAEVRLAGIWSELLGVEQIGVHDNFFELGGHSLMATRVIARIDDALGVRLTLRDLFEAPTIQRLGELVAAAGGGAPATDDDREELEF